jgi:hypothetical protein
MIELCEAEINAVSGGDGRSEAEAAIAQLSKEKPWDPYAHARHTS